MNVQLTHTTRAQMTRELAAFITRKISDTSCGWPRRLAKRRAHRTQVVTRGMALRVLIIGDLTLELPIDMQVTKAQAVELLRDTAGQKKACWKMSRARVGGFVGHCARAAVSLGAEVSVCTIIPCPWPSQFDAFFEKWNLEDRFVTSLPGACPVTAVLRCTDGVVCKRRRTVINAAGLDLPFGVESDYDVILVDLSQFGRRHNVLSVLHNSLNATNRRFVVGMQIFHDWTRSDLSVAHDGRVWTFADYPEAAELARRVDSSVAPLESGGDSDLLAKSLHDECGINKLVLRLGSRGAVLVNGVPRPYHARACPVQPIRPAGDQDVLLTVTALSSATGTADNRSLSRGVMAATSHSAGLALPTCLEELDVS